jgi:multiple sugar transport system substrate-binding protein
MSAKAIKGAGICLALILAIGVIPSASQSAENVTINLAHPYGKIFRPIHQAVIKEFNKTPQGKNITVKLEAPYPDYEQVAQRTLIGATQGNAPVISFQGINQIRQYIDGGHAYDLSEFKKNDPRWKEKGTYYPAMMRLGVFNGKQYAIPFAISTPIMYINVDLFKKAGLDPNSPPTNWPGVIAAAKKIDALGDDIVGMFYDYLITGNWCLQALVWSEGGSFMDKGETKVTLDQAPGQRAYKLLRKFIDEGVQRDWNRKQGEQSFIAGKVGFYFSSTSWLKGVQDKAVFDLKTALFPFGSSGLRRLPTGGNGAVIITDDPKKAKAAYEYAMFAAGPIGTAIMVKGSGYMPMHAKGRENLASFYAANPNFVTSLKQIPIIFRWYSFPGKNTLKIIDILKDSMQAVVAKKTEPVASLNSAVAEIRKLIKK